MRKSVQGLGSKCFKRLNPRELPEEPYHIPHSKGEIKGVNQVHTLDNGVNLPYGEKEDPRGIPKQDNM